MRIGKRKGDIAAHDGEPQQQKPRAQKRRTDVFCKNPYRGGDGEADQDRVRNHERPRGSGCSEAELAEHRRFYDGGCEVIFEKRIAHRAAADINILLK